MKSSIRISSSFSYSFFAAVLSQFSSRFIRPVKGVLTFEGCRVKSNIRFLEARYLLVVDESQALDISEYYANVAVFHAKYGCMAH
jgi:hypothetical protein